MLLWLPVGASARSPVYAPPNSVALCLDGAQIVAAGPSELAGLLAWLTGGAPIATRRNTKRMVEAESSGESEHNKLAAARSLACTTRRNLADRHFQCAGSYREKAVCREQLYGKKPFEANCTGTTPSWRNASFGVTYMWKSFQFSPTDLLLRQSAQRLASRGRVIVVLSAGLQEFSRFTDHREKLLHNVRDDEEWPQEWLDGYLNRTAQLFSLFAGDVQRPSNSQSTGKRHRGHVRRPPCVVWRAQNIAARHTNASEPRHHPSAVNGPHHWLNRISIALARMHGLKVLDYTDATISRRPLDHSTDGHGWMTAKAVDALEGDVYHGYRMGELAPLFLQGLADACCK